MSGSRTRLVLVLLLVAAFLALRVEAGEEAAREAVPKDLVRVDDGDSLLIRWPAGAEVVRILGVDTPEVQHLDHDIPYAQPFGEKAAGFLEGALAVASRVEILRAADKDPYGRTLAYVFLDGKNYSVLVAEAGLAVENVSHFGDNGFPAEAAAVREAAERAGPAAFEPPYRYRARMRQVAEWMREHGTYPLPPRREDAEPEGEEER